jgi:hypothetical protein
VRRNLLESISDGSILYQPKSGFPVAAGFLVPGGPQQEDSDSQDNQVEEKLGDALDQVLDRDD